MHHSLAVLSPSTGLRAATPEIRAQIDEYLARGLHKRLPATDSRILPAKRSLDWDSLTPSASASDVLAATRTRRSTSVAHATRVEESGGWPPAEAVVLSVGPCAAAAGSKRATRYLLWSVGSTIGELRARGLRLSDLHRDVQSGRVVLSGGQVQ